MLEFLLCSLITILPDWLYRRFRQGKRWGKEITIYSLWYELRWGLTTCAILTVGLITVIFYFHPSTTNVTSYFRTVTILSESGGRVAEVYVKNHQLVKAGDPLFRLDDSSQKAAAETARTRIEEVNAAIKVTTSELGIAKSNVQQAEAALKQAADEFRRKNTLTERGSAAVAAREVERLENLVDEREAALNAAMANMAVVTDRIQVQLPAQKASAEASLAQTENELRKLTVLAGVDGRVGQFALQTGDIVNPILRPAGILVPTDVGRNTISAGFDQLTAQVIKPGMLAEVTCLTNPLRIVPMVVTDVLAVIPAGQFRPTDRMIDIQDSARPGTLTVSLEPLYEGAIDRIPQGSKCIANAYTNNHDLLDAPDIGNIRWLSLHAVDAVGVAHAAILRLQALLLPIQMLVLSGH
ncbi:HlyD family secretion protein [Pseudopelagicola sp. nBUS_19]|uniref:HlyD family secretion protein n=1 Tax=unclassified Pseudopelagicola TaxID=2649563 RepID=UPI003EBF90C5